MTTYTAWMTDEESGNEGVYDFEAPADLLDQTPVRIVRTFMDHVDRDLFPRTPIDYEINAAIKHGPGGVVTAMGSWLHGPGTTAMPFTLFIGRRR